MNKRVIFDQVRQMLGRSFTDAEVKALDAAIDASVAFPVTRTLGQKGEALIKKWEGYAKDLGDGRVQAYPDPATGGDPWTIGWGSTGPDISRGTIWTRETAQRRFAEHVEKFSEAVAKAVGTSSTTQEQFDAMVSLAYNVGVGNFTGSTLLKKHKAGDHEGAANEFGKWVKAAGRTMQGLVNRRAEEAKLYRGEA